MIQCSHCQKIFKNPSIEKSLPDLNQSYHCQICGESDFIEYKPQWSYLFIPLVGTTFGFILAGVVGGIFGCVLSLFFIERDK